MEIKLNYTSKIITFSGSFKIKELLAKIEKLKDCNIISEEWEVCTIQNNITYYPTVPDIIPYWDDCTGNKTHMDTLTKN